MKGTTTFKGRLSKSNLKSFGDFYAQIRLWIDMEFGQKAKYFVFLFVHSAVGVQQANPCRT